MTVAATPIASVPPLAVRTRTVGGSPVRDILAVTGRPEVINFAGGLPAPELFDRDGVAAAFRHVLEETPGRALQYATTEGEPVLREHLARRMSARRAAARKRSVWRQRSWNGSFNHGHGNPPRPRPRAPAA
jgi:2-aminoadipate transaminase